MDCARRMVERGDRLREVVKRPRDRSAVGRDLSQRKLCGPWDLFQLHGKLHNLDKSVPHVLATVRCIHISFEYHFTHDVTPSQILGGASRRRGVSPGLGVLGVEGMSIIPPFIFAVSIRRDCISVHPILSPASLITAA